MCCKCGDLPGLRRWRTIHGLCRTQLPIPFWGGPFRTTSCRKSWAAGAWAWSIRRRLAPGPQRCIEVSSGRHFPGRAGDRAFPARSALDASSLNHPNICTIYDIGEFEGRPFIAMELLERADAEASNFRQAHRDCGRFWIREFRLRMGLKRHIRRTISPGHQAGEHFSGEPRSGEILDFGLAKLATQRHASSDSVIESAQRTQTTVEGAEFVTSPGSSMGTVAYMSPEQARAGFGRAIGSLFARRGALRDGHRCGSFHRDNRGIDFRWDFARRSDARRPIEFAIAGSALERLRESAGEGCGSALSDRGGITRGFKAHQARSGFEPASRGGKG